MCVHRSYERYVIKGPDIVLARDQIGSLVLEILQVTMRNAPDPIVIPDDDPVG